MLFFAGPTGVGKTELAKTLTQLIFGDERAYIRFDMSEFAEEHTGARLLGAPPGYIGYDAGGELTNAVRDKPFSVVLFDEIEKAHPRILDKFLQILEDGRLTDGRGETAYFSEAILVFTSNLGIYVEDEHGRRVQNVSPGRPARRRRGARARRDPGLLQVPPVAPGDPQPHRRQHRRVRLHHAGDRRADLRRHAAQRRRRACATSTRSSSRIADAVRAQLRELCTRDLSQRRPRHRQPLESLFVNPLSRALFRFPLDGPRRGRRCATLTEDDEPHHDGGARLKRHAATRARATHRAQQGALAGHRARPGPAHRPVGAGLHDPLPAAACRRTRGRATRRRRSRSTSSSRGAASVAGDALDGVTISGGEPFDQPAGAARAAATALDAWRRDAQLDFDILCYSGYPLRTLEREHAAILARLDAVIPEPYVDGLPLGNVWRGSSQPDAGAAVGARPRALRGVRRRAAPTPTASACRSRSKAAACG